MGSRAGSRPEMEWEKKGDSLVNQEN